MFYQPDSFHFLRPFIDNVETISREFHAAVQKVPQLGKFMSDELPELTSHVDYWYKEVGLEGDPRVGTWGAFPIIKEQFPVKWYDARESFPTVFKYLSGVDGFFSAFFFRLGPGSSTLEHTHDAPNLIFHLCLTETNGPCYLKCDGEERELKKKGDALLFDYTKPHSTRNLGTSDRVSLIIDFKNPFYKKS